MGLAWSQLAGAPLPVCMLNLRLGHCHWYNVYMKKKKKKIDFWRQLLEFWNTLCWDEGSWWSIWPFLENATFKQTSPIGAAKIFPGHPPPQLYYIILYYYYMFQDLSPVSQIRSCRASLPFVQSTALRFVFRNPLINKKKKQINKCSAFFPLFSPHHVSSFLQLVNGYNSTLSELWCSLFASVN
jgi:hypothetical protein